MTLIRGPSVEHKKCVWGSVEGGEGVYGQSGGFVHDASASHDLHLLVVSEPRSSAGVSSQHVSLFPSSRGGLRRTVLVDDGAGALPTKVGRLDGRVLELHLTGSFKCLLISGNTNKQSCLPGAKDKT